MDQMMRGWVVRNRVDDRMPGKICTAMRVSSAELATCSILCLFFPAVAATAATAAAATAAVCACEEYTHKIQ